MLSGGRKHPQLCVEPPDKMAAAICSPGKPQLQRCASECSPDLNATQRRRRTENPGAAGCGDDRPPPPPAQSNIVRRPFWGEEGPLPAQEADGASTCLRTIKAYHIYRHGQIIMLMKRDSD
ncbi:hypothetical protein NDU88_007269 [Pleurodeles waltl]|uniref:Uncharacterized protein n=1 Tax=Pleurodeles waltl TaxID=8319 RepID=A0AAV7QN91_PLEWA|nr:hypothetical protein NDU88_007269 [Pleurodeles waltl]